MATSFSLRGRIALIRITRPPVNSLGLAVRKGAVHYSFTTDNLGQPPHSIEVRLAEGPFRSLKGMWRFAPSALGTRVSLHLEFEFENRLVGAALAPLFKLMTSSLVASFRKRAGVVYGQR